LVYIAFGIITKTPYFYCLQFSSICTGNGKNKILQLYTDTNS